MTERTDRELLELAAKAAGKKVRIYEGMVVEPGTDCVCVDEGGFKWSPLIDDGDALRLAVRLNMDICYESCPDGVSVTVVGAWDGAPEPVQEIFEHNGPKAVRHAIVRAAAAMAEGGEHG